MKNRFWMQLAVAAMLPVLAGAAAPKSGLAVIDTLEAGKWHLTEKSKPGGVDRTVCLPDKIALIQVAHPDAECSRFVIDDQPRSGTVHYTCPKGGHGRTTLRLETPRRVEIETQGVWNGMPFNMLLDAQKTGVCKAK